RYRARQRMYRPRVDNAGSYDDIWVRGDQPGGGSLAPLWVLAGYPALNGEIMPLDPAETPHRFVEPAARERPPVTMNPMCGLFGASSAPARQPAAESAVPNRRSRRLMQSTIYLASTRRPAMALGSRR